MQQHNSGTPTTPPLSLDQLTILANMRLYPLAAKLKIDNAQTKKIPQGHEIYARRASRADLLSIFL